MVIVVKNVNNEKVVKNWNLNFEVHIGGLWYTYYWKNQFGVVQIFKYLQKNVKIVQILENTLNAFRYNSYIMCYFLCLEVCYPILIFWIVFFSSCPMTIFIPILINIPTPFNFQCINFCPRLYMYKSLLLMKFKITMCKSVVDMKDCNEEVLT